MAALTVFAPDPGAAALAAISAAGRRHGWPALRSSRLRPGIAQDRLVGELLETLSTDLGEPNLMERDVMQSILRLARGGLQRQLDVRNRLLDETGSIKWHSQVHDGHAAGNVATFECQVLMDAQCQINDPACVSMRAKPIRIDYRGSHHPAGSLQQDFSDRRLEGFIGHRGSP
jgi:hypothetical protein